NAATSVGPAGCTNHQSGSSALTASAAHRVLPTEDPPVSSTNPPRSAAVATLALTPNPSESASRGTYSGGTSSGTPRTLLAAPRRRSRRYRHGHILRRSICLPLTMIGPSVSRVTPTRPGSALNATGPDLFSRGLGSIRDNGLLSGAHYGK